MKVGYPALGIAEEDRELLANDFTNCGLVGIFDTDTEAIEIVSSEIIGTNLLEWAASKDIEAIITPDIQVMALKVFRERGISVYQAEGQLLALNISLLENMCLTTFSVMEKFSEGAGSCSSGSCGTCSSSCN